MESEYEEAIWSAEAWHNMVMEAMAGQDPEYIRNVYERLLQQFPTAGKYWSMYVEFEMTRKNYERVEAIFQRCLATLLHVDVWKTYLNYVKMTKEDQKKDAYEFTLSVIGMDMASTPIWMEYIAYLKEQDINLHLDVLRRTFHRAVTNPIQNVEMIWKDFDAFENNLNKLTAKKLITERSGAYMTARSVLKERKTLMETINKNLLARPPKLTEKEDPQWVAWKNLIAWEKKNPLRLEETNAVVDRVVFSYRQALMALRFYPELWYDFANYLMEHGRIKEAGEYYAQGIETLPNSLILHFAYVEVEESRKNLEACKVIYENLLKNCQKRLDLLTIKLRDENSMTIPENNEMTSEKHEENGLVKEKSILNTSESTTTLDPIGDKVRKMFLEREKKESLQPSRESMEMQLKAIGREETLVYIQYMQFARRIEGMRSFRLIFSRARKSPHTTYHVFIASALTEFVCNKDPNVGLNIFRVGAGKFGEEPEYILHYLDYLTHLNDDNNIRALFERALSTIPSEHARVIWDRFVEYEAKYGDFSTLQKVEKRRADIYPEELSGLASIVQRYRYLDLLPTPENDLKTLACSKVKGVNTQVAQPIVNVKVGNTLLSSADKSSHLPRPDLKQMLPYKVDLKKSFLPSQQPMAPIGLSQTSISQQQQQQQPMSLGNLQPFRHILTSPMFATLAKLLHSLPPAHLFRGPFIQPEDLLSLLLTTPIPSSLISTAPSFSQKKRRGKEGHSDDEPNDHGLGHDSSAAVIAETMSSDANCPPMHDIYRHRQQKRLHTSNF